MRQSTLLTRTRREAPSDETSKNAQLLIRAGFVHKEMAGVYSFLPLGLRVLDRINGVIREEMDRIGGQEVFLSSLQDASLWAATDRLDETRVDVWFKTALKGSDQPLPLAFTHEEPITAAMKNHIASYKDLPRYAYQIQTKFRNEARAKSGVMRGREFLMKDLYSFSRSQEELDAFYESVKQAYARVFERVGLGDRTFLTFASGGSFAKYSHEYQTLCDAGEDVIYVSRAQKIAINQEVLNDEVLSDLGLARDTLEEAKAAEVGNIFKLGTRFSEPLGLRFVDENGESRPVIMGSYGIGPSRLLGTIVECLSDDRGMVWPATVAPFQVHLLSLGAPDEADRLYGELRAAGIETLYDDREASAGEKFAESDLYGIPVRLVVSGRSLEKGGVEAKRRTEAAGTILPMDGLVSGLRQTYLSL